MTQTELTPAQLHIFNRLAELREIKARTTRILSGDYTWDERFDAAIEYQAARREQKKIHEAMDLKTYVQWTEYQGRNLG
jgi:hypothetical protein